MRGRRHCRRPLSRHQVDPLCVGRELRDVLEGQAGGAHTIASQDERRDLRELTVSTGLGRGHARIVFLATDLGLTRH